MPRLMPSTLVVVLCFGFIPSQSSAACAWILWSRSSHSIPGKETVQMAWEPHAFETRKECETAKNAWFNRKRGPNEKVERMTEDIQSIRSEDLLTILNLKCLPDTVKPEGHGP